MYSSDSKNYFWKIGSVNPTLDFTWIAFSLCYSNNPKRTYSFLNIFKTMQATLDLVKFLVYILSPKKLCFLKTWPIMHSFVKHVLCLYESHHFIHNIL